MSDLAELMKAALELERHIPPHLQPGWELVRNAAMREGGRQFADSLIEHEQDRLADIISLEWHRERLG